MNKDREIKKTLRREVFGWQIATVGLLALSVSANAAMYGFLCRDTAKHSQETDDLRNDLYMAEQVRDHAVQELGDLSIRYNQEHLDLTEHEAAYDGLAGYRYIRQCTITAYCPCEECCGKWADGLTATGIPAVSGIVAVDPEVIPIGATVIIDGQKYLAADTGVTGNCIDICFDDHKDASDFGVRTSDVWVVEK